MDRKLLLTLTGKVVGGVFADLNGTSHRFSRSDADFPESGITNDLTIQAWIKPSASGFHPIVTKYNAVGSKRVYLFALYEDELYLQVSGDGAPATFRQSTNGNFELDKWYHVAVSYDASAGDCFFYKNGALLTDDGTALANTIADKNSDFRIGAYASATNLWEGSIGPVHLFDDIRTPAEILTSATDPTEDLSLAGNIIGQWMFNDAAAATQIDNSQGDAGRDLDLLGGDTTNYGTHTRAVVPFQ